MFRPAQDEAPDGTPWSIAFDLREEEFVFDEAHTRRRFSQVSLFDKTPRVLLPLSVVLDDTAFDEWRERGGLTRELANRARALRSAFIDYQIPVVPLATDDITVVTRTFKRVNDGGTKIGAVDMARALAWTEEFDLRKYFDAVRAQLASIGWSSLEDDALLKVVEVVSGNASSKLDAEAEPEILAKRIKANPELVEQAGHRVGEAAALLGERLGMEGPSTLPYTQVLVFVAQAIHCAPQGLSESQKDTLVAWVAEACMSERFRGATPNTVRADWRGLHSRLELPGAEPARQRDQKRPWAQECWRFSMAWARSRVTALVLAGQCPLSATGAPVEGPHRLIAHNGETVGMLLASGAEGVSEPLGRLLASRSLEVALRSPANRVIATPEELPALRRLLCSPQCPPPVRESHLIDAAAHGHLVAGSLTEFFERRRVLIREAETRWVSQLLGDIDLPADPRTYSDG
jgi:hypothetical protein